MGLLFVAWLIASGVVVAGTAWHIFARVQGRPAGSWAFWSLVLAIPVVAPAPAHTFTVLPYVLNLIFRLEGGFVGVNLVAVGVVILVHAWHTDGPTGS